MRKSKQDTLTEAIRTVARLARVIERVTQEHGLSLPQYRLLAFVARAPHRAGELATRAAVTRPALTDLVDGLVRQGLLAREPVAGDRRGVSLILTPEGSTTLEAAERALATRIGELVRDAGADEILPGLAAVGEHLDALWRARAEEART